MAEVINMAVVMIMVGRDRSEEVPRLVLGKESSLMALALGCQQASQGGS